MSDIDLLLEKYFEGQTTLEEESILRNYFRQSEIEDRYKVYAPMFNYFSAERKEVAVEKKKKKIPFYVWISVAASILLIIGIRSFNSVSVGNDMGGTFVYVDGKKVTDQAEVSVAALNSIRVVSEVDNDVVSSQIGILDSFTE